ncbi:pirin family protein [Croceicoccus sp. F390]|uniref:Pirin family protein n=1 Tax=Croceicoccus esteveae TaxID=3075597 RepID=A0ABU2ZN05_9SPHN|nr:pirin family protein [Croceicoccus sp. F390]MDT0576959.1 pirin family protein [Croceicoccus sp. F390]
MSTTTARDQGECIEADNATIDMTIDPKVVDLGEMEVRRALPSIRRQMIGPFIFFDEMGPAAFSPGEGINVRPHPHINLATLTYLFEGEILHRDSLGTEQAIEPGAVNWMKAGRGIVHSERTRHELKESGQRLHGIQTWMALPVDAEESEPEFTHLEADALPVHEADGVWMRLIAGRAFGLQSPLQTASETFYADVKLQAGQSSELDFIAEERGLYTVEGEIQIAGETFSPGQLLVLKDGEKVAVTARSDARFMLLGGASMGDNRYIWWNFVSSSRERIEQAKQDWTEGRFDTVPGDDKEFIPLPTDRGKPRKAAGAVAYP